MNGSIESIDPKEKSIVTNEEEQKETINQNTITQHSKHEDDFEVSDSSEKDVPEYWKQKRLHQDIYDIIDERLQNIVIIEKQLMEEWRKE